MPEKCLTSLNHVVALGGGHGLGRVMSSLNDLGPKLTGIVTTTDNGGSTGRIRRSEGGIAWGDMRNCLNQLITVPSTASKMFEYRFAGNGELSGHNLGNLMLKALDHLSIRPLEAINLIRDLLKIDSFLIPMSEQPVDLMAFDQDNNPIYGEVNIDALSYYPNNIQLTHKVTATKEAITAIEKAQLIIIGPGSFFTSLMPLFLMEELVIALNKSTAILCYLGNLGPEISKAAAALSLFDKLGILEEKMLSRKIDAVVISDWGNKPSRLEDKVLIKTPLSSLNEPNLHDRKLLRLALNEMINRYQNQ
ncbi:uridine diphosphate-N-acetylglucosamine-binding protein YvcK [Thorsellia anophelis]|uniref:Putative gluconeogenesis factor n=1 Tax=Thorsellia anophelis DSM 18579 TaxID=1123402 RepID=A0A1I0EDD4_9GAMM|nr:uridine diphosphate-N-acetylglucosamine-binding protein YvcK [Thorsellia anophelis]SET43047.1 conserved hypothetical protein, cofD-related [Thorsellia anophelis DSM 18579]